MGPTATGKSRLGMILARELGGEIVNTDAMQVYRGMDIGTAKLPASERRGIPHHLLDLMEVTEPASVAEFQRWARDVIADCRGRGAVPILVGGSALYTRAILDRFEFPGTDPAVRHQLEEELAEIGPEAMHRRLTAVDADDGRPDEEAPVEGDQEAERGQMSRELHDEIAQELLGINARLLAFERAAAGRAGKLLRDLHATQHLVEEALSGFGRSLSQRHREK